MAVRNAGFCARDTGFFAVFGVSLQMEGQNAGFCVRDTEFSAILGVSLQAAGQIAVRDGCGCWLEMAGKMLPGCRYSCRSGCLAVCLVGCLVGCLAGSQTSSPMM